MATARQRRKDVNDGQTGLSKTKLATPVLDPTSWEQLGRVNNNVYGGLVDHKGSLHHVQTFPGRLGLLPFHGAYPLLLTSLLPDSGHGEFHGKR
uniref:Uncharacterized protein n=1 Tax=Oryza meridionalis TaxID=40149 RepID=A0A0E0FAE4_9ORYZ